MYIYICIYIYIFIYLFTIYWHWKWIHPTPKWHLEPWDLLVKSRACIVIWRACPAWTPAQSCQGDKTHEAHCCSTPPPTLIVFLRVLCGKMPYRSASSLKAAWTQERSGSFETCYEHYLAFHTPCGAIAGSGAKVAHISMRNSWFDSRAWTLAGSATSNPLKKACCLSSLNSAMKLPLRAKDSTTSCKMHNKDTICKISRAAACPGSWHVAYPWPQAETHFRITCACTCINTIRSLHPKNKDQTLGPTELPGSRSHPEQKCYDENAKTKWCRRMTTQRDITPCISALQRQGGAPLSLEDVDATVEDCPHAPVATAQWLRRTHYPRHKFDINCNITGTEWCTLCICTPHQGHFEANRLRGWKVPINPSDGLEVSDKPFR